MLNLLIISVLIPILSAYSGNAVGPNNKNELAVNDNTNGDVYRWHSGRLTIQGHNGFIFAIDDDGNIGGGQNTSPAVWAKNGQTYTTEGQGAVTVLGQGVATCFINSHAHYWDYKNNILIPLQQLQDGGGANPRAIVNNVIIGSSSERVLDNGRYYYYQRPVYWTFDGIVHEIEYQEEHFGAYTLNASTAGIVGEVVEIYEPTDRYYQIPVFWSSVNSDFVYLPWIGAANGITASGIIWGCAASCNTCSDCVGALWYDGLIHYPTFDGTIPNHSASYYVQQIKGINRTGSMLLYMSDGSTLFSIRDGIIGDCNGDNVVNNFDVDAFVTALINMQPCADVNQDGLVNNFDIDEFLNILLSD